MKIQGWSRWLISVLLVWVPLCVAQVSLTPLADTIYRADGSAASGEVVLTWPTFTTVAGQSVPAGTTTVTLGAGGALSVSLAPNAGALPVGTAYTAVYHLLGQAISRETWVVPVSAAPVKLSAVHSQVLSSSVAMQTVTKGYVDAAIAAAVTGTPTSGTGSPSSGNIAGAAITSSTITASTVDATPLGATTPAAGRFTTLATTGIIETGQYTNSSNGAASTPAALFTGTPYSGGSGTTTKPLFLFQPAGTPDITTWSAAGTVFGVAVPSSFGGNLFDMYTGGTPVFSIARDGTFNARGSITGFNLVAENGMYTAYLSGPDPDAATTLYGAAGAISSRNKADAVTATTSYQQNAASTGHIHDFQDSTGVVAYVDRGGAIFGANVKAGESVVAFSTTPVFSTGYQSNVITLTGDVSSFTLTAGAAGQQVCLIFVQDSTGSRTVAAPGNVRGFFTVGSTAGKVSQQCFTYSTALSAWIAQSAGAVNM